MNGYQSMKSVDLSRTAEPHIVQRRDLNAAFPLLKVRTTVLVCTFTMLGRMTRLANCRNAKTRLYENRALSVEFGAEYCDLALRVYHNLIWEDWLHASPAQQSADFLQSLREFHACSESASHGTSGNLFADALPDGLSEGERKRFRATIERFILEQQTASPDPLSWEARVTAGSQRPFLTSSKSHSSRSLRANRIVSLVDGGYMDPDLSLKLLSGRLHISSRHLGRLFSTRTGKTFRAYLRDTRMEAASELLLYSAHDVKAIAGMVGYHDRSHFGEDFRRTKGYTPLEFRLTNRRVLENTLGCRTAQ